MSESEKERVWRSCERSSDMRNEWRRIFFRYRGNDGNRLQRKWGFSPRECSRTFWCTETSIAHDLIGDGYPVVDLGVVPDEFEPDLAMNDDGSPVLYR